LKVGILTSTDTRHRYFVNALRRACNLVAVCYQDTGYSPSKAAETVNGQTARIVKHHFDERTRQETFFFGHDAERLADSRTCGVAHVTPETLNTPDTVDFLRRRGAEAVVVYGTSLVKEPLLSAFAGRMTNMHLGLSPYYRGTATNFYPLVNDEPEYVGATIHLIDPGIDSGDIIHHARPEIVADDMPHTVGCKAILAGIEKVIQTLGELAAGTMQSVPQWKPPNARLYLRKHYKPEHVVQLYDMIEASLSPATSPAKTAWPTPCA